MQKKSDLFDIIWKYATLRFAPPQKKITISLLEAFIRAHLVIRLSFYDKLKISQFFVVLIWPFSMQILKSVADFQMMSNKSDFFCIDHFCHRYIIW